MNDKEKLIKLAKAIIKASNDMQGEGHDCIFRKNKRLH